MDIGPTLIIIHELKLWVVFAFNTSMVFILKVDYDKFLRYFTVIKCVCSIYLNDRLSIGIFPQNILLVHCLLFVV